MSSNILYIELFQYLALAWIGYMLWGMKGLLERFLKIYEAGQKDGH